MKKDLQDSIRKMLSDIVFMTLATASPDRYPWSSPVFYAYDNVCNFYWLSSPKSRHSINIDLNPHISFVIFDSTRADWDAFGLYIEAKAKKIADTDMQSIRRAHETCYARAGKEPIDPARFTGDYPRKYYKAIPERVWVNAIEEIDGVPVDIREEISLKDFRQVLI